jgi:hypothetical protein
MESREEIIGMAAEMLASILFAQIISSKVPPQSDTEGTNS